MKSGKLTKLLQFLREDLKLPERSVQLALRRSGSTPSYLPIALWHYGLISIQQLDKIFDWLDHERHLPPCGSS